MGLIYSRRFDKLGLLKQSLGCVPRTAIRRFNSLTPKISLEIEGLSLNPSLKNPIEDRFFNTLKLLPVG
jgi:hypothetical protein